MQTLLLMLLKSGRSPILNQHLKNALVNTHNILYPHCKNYSHIHHNTSINKMMNNSRSRLETSEPYNNDLMVHMFAQYLDPNIYFDRWVVVGPSNAYRNRRHLVYRNLLIDFFFGNACHSVLRAIISIYFTFLNS